MKIGIDIPKIAEEEKSERVVLLLEIIKQQQEIIQELKDEIARLKGHKPRPTIKPSQLESVRSEKPAGGDEKRPGSDKRHKSAAFVIHEELKVAAAGVPEGSKFKGYKDFIVQDLHIHCHNTTYLLEYWQTPEGGYIIADPPTELDGKHFGVELVRFILYQYHHCHVTQPLLLEQLHEIGVDVSAGQLNNILVENNDAFHREKDAILTAGLKVSSHVNVDDTGARHQGKKGYCTHIGNEWFCWFETTSTKSRINFLGLLRAGRTDYVINSEALNYWEAHKLPRSVMEILGCEQPMVFADDSQWELYLEGKGVHSARHVQIATEGALIGSIIEHGIPRNLIVISDDAGQFNVLLHGLCWIHAERSINKITPVSEKGKEALQAVRTKLWGLYQDLKAYKLNPDPIEAKRLEQLFDEIFTGKPHSASLNNALKRIHQNKSELLLVLRHPEAPLHNNLSENDIREYVKRRKISGGTRSESGRRSRDTFASLKKTCRKFGISFWGYLGDRLKRIGSIPHLADLILSRAFKPG